MQRLLLPYVLGSAEQSGEVEDQSLPLLSSILTRNHIYKGQLR